MTHLIENTGTEDQPVYRFQYSLWTTEASSLYGEDGAGYRQAIYKKGDLYALPSWSSYDVPFARECGWEEVVSFPSHHDVVDGPQFLGDALWRTEFNQWYSNLPLEETGIEFELLGDLDKILGAHTPKNSSPRQALREAAVLACALYRVGRNINPDAPNSAVGVQAFFKLWKKAENGQEVHPARFVWAAQRLTSNATASWVAQKVAQLVERGEFDVLTAAWEWLWNPDAAQKAASELRH